MNTNTNTNIALPTIDVLDAIIAIQSRSTPDTCDVILDNVYEKGDIGIIRQAARRCGQFVTFDYVDDGEIKTVEVY